MSTNLSKIQKQALITVAKQGDQTKISERTLAALDSRGLVALDLDAYVLTDEGVAYLKRVGEFDAVEADLKGEAPAAPAKKKGKSKTQKAAEKAAQEREAREGTVPVDEGSVTEATPHGKTTLTKAPAKSKDDTIRISRQILAYLAESGQMRVDLEKKIADAPTAKDESKRIDVTDADLDDLAANAEAMSNAGLGRGDVRSANALVSWIEGMKARRAAQA